ncbi:MAG: superoxide dismutase [Pseudomonadota bacterium]|jgi:Fe-Mn family superoxide dismutase|nr:superoxide dismutase [Alphaproteobacteria bacterium]
MAFTLPSLPYAKNALAPYISEQTLDFHHGKHHQTYVTNLNNLVQGTENESKGLEELINLSHAKADMAGIFNNAAQVWNHAFFWHCMKPNGGGQPTGAIAEKINTAFGSYEKFAAEFKQAALTQFGSGWAWLVQEGDTLKIIKTPNADLPMVHNQTALLTCDVWEHAYYLDYQNRRADFVQTFLDHLLNWDFVNQNLV